MVSVLLAIGPSFEKVIGWLSVGGYPALFGLLFCCGLGLPVPEDVPLIIAGALVQQGKMHLVVAAIVAWCGIIGGDCVLYTLGWKLGPKVSDVPIVGRHVTRERIAKMTDYFEKYGMGVVAVGRLVAGVRGAMVVAAGTTRFNFFKFIIADGLAAIVSGGMFMLIGHWAGSKLADPETQKFIHKFETWFLIGAIVLVLAFVAWLIWKSRHRHDVMKTEEKVVEKLSAAAKVAAHPIKTVQEKKEALVAGSTAISTEVDAPSQQSYPSGGPNHQGKEEH